MKVVFLSLEYDIATFSGNGIHAQSQVRALRHLSHQVLVICGRPRDAADSTLHVTPGRIEVPLSVWGRLDAGSAWQEYAAGCAAPLAVQAVAEFDANFVLGVDWHSMAAYDGLAAELLNRGCRVPPCAYSNYRVYLRSAPEEERQLAAGAAAMAAARGWSEEANAAALVQLLQQSVTTKAEPAAARCEACAGITSGALHGCEVPPSSSNSSRTRGGVDVRTAGELQYLDFVAQYLDQGRPVIITGATEGWRAAAEWAGADGSVAIDLLERQFGASVVSVTDTARRHRGGGPCREVTVAEYCRWWREHTAKAAAAKADPRAPFDSGCHEAELLYLKDWHFAGEWPGYGAYSCPPQFSDDWLNYWLDTRASGCDDVGNSNGNCAPPSDPSPAGCGVTTTDYRFVYLGPAGTSTPLHTDVLRSHSWSANVAGRKRWRLLPPHASHLVRDRTGGATAHDIFADVGDVQARDGTEVGAARPAVNGPVKSHAAHATAQRLFLEVEQGPGEVLFVPSGWFHTVHNIENCLSINCNWISRQSVGSTWAHLRQERAAAAAAISDCAALCGGFEFEELVQRNTAANCGMDYSGFGEMLRCAADDAMRVGQGGRPLGWVTAQLTPEQTAAEASARLQAAHAMLSELWAAQAEINRACAAANLDSNSGRGKADAEVDGAARRRLVEAEAASLRCLERMTSAVEAIRADA